MIETGEIKENLDRVLGQIEDACERAGRDPAGITLITVTKTFDLSVVERAVAAGATNLGENYIQEAREKIEGIFDSGGAGGVRWHFIGHLQRNKAKYAIKLFDLIHSVDGLPLAVELDKRAKGVEKVQDILVQVNISHEERKSGIEVEGVTNLVQEISILENLRVLGLMGMPPFGLDMEEVRPFFTALRELKEKVEAENIPGVSMDELSMGMSADYPVAIEEGATMVRVGTAIFGPRR